MRQFLSVTLVSAVLCLSPALCRAAEPEQQDNPYENTSIFVEAFVVEVQNAALAEAGVNPLGQAPDNVTPLKILWCLKDDDRAKVISGAKLTARQSGSAKSETSSTTYFGREVKNTVSNGGKATTVSDVRYDAYSGRNDFTIRPTIKSEQQVHCFYEYEETIIQKHDDRQGPPDQVKYNWSGNLTAQSGQPVIAAAVQGESTTIFFILTATIQADGEKQ